MVVLLVCHWFIQPSLFSSGRWNWPSRQNINARAALISGPPGIGKTTSCRELRPVSELAGDVSTVSGGYRYLGPSRTTWVHPESI